MRTLRSELFGSQVEDHNKIHRLQLDMMDADAVDNDEERASIKRKVFEKYELLIMYCASILGVVTYVNQ